MKFNFLSHYFAFAVLFGAAVLVGFSTSAAQAWDAVWTQGGFEFEEGTEIAIDNAGNVYVAGFAAIANRGDTDMVVIKYNNLGVQQWDYMYDGGLHNALGADEPVGVGYDSSGNVYVSGKSRFQRSGGQDYDYVTIKLNANGVHQWTRYYDYLGGSYDHGDDTAMDMQVDLAGNVWVTGDSDGDYLTVMYDAAGTEAWVNRYDGDSAGDNSHATAVAFDGQRGSYVTGYSQHPVNHGYDYATIKYNAAGTQVWKSRYDSTETHDFKPWDVAVDGNGNVAVTGRTAVGDLSNADYDITTVYYSSNGNQSWAKTFSGTGFGDADCDEGFAVDFDNSGNVFVGGYAHMTGNATDFIVIKYSAVGVQQWMDHYNEVPGEVGGGDSLDRGYDLAVDGAGRVYIVGGLDVDSGLLVIHETYGIVTYSNSGDVLDVRYFDADPTLWWDDKALAVAVTNAGDVAVTGSAFGTATIEDIGTTVVYSDDSIFIDGFESGDFSEWSTVVSVLPTK